MKDKAILIFGGLLILLALIKPELSWIKPDPSPAPTDIVIVEDINEETKKLVQPVVDAFKNGPNDRLVDGKKLSNLFSDMATLVNLTDSDQVVKTTNEVREANKLSGNMLKLNLVSKYPNLKQACNNFMITMIGNDDLPLNSDLRKKTVDAFNALAWACNEGSK